MPNKSIGLFFYFNFWMLDFRWTASDEIPLVHLCVSICLCIAQESFLKYGSLVFSNIAHDDS